MDQEQIRKEIEAVAVDGRVSCHDLRELAEKLELPYHAVGKVCTDENIKIHSCELGCF